MRDFRDWLDVQNGADVRGSEAYADGFRFVTTLRDLAPWVHYDALYEAYLDACLILLDARRRSIRACPSRLPTTSTSRSPSPSSAVRFSDYASVTMSSRCASVSRSRSECWRNRS